MEYKKIRGELGGGGEQPSQPRTPVESDDTLQSTSIARVMALISEGEIAGFNPAAINAKVYNQTYTLTPSSPNARITQPPELNGYPNVTGRVTSVSIAPTGATINAINGQVIFDGYQLMGDWSGLVGTYDITLTTNHFNVFPCEYVQTTQTVSRYKSVSSGVFSLHRGYSGIRSNGCLPQGYNVALSLYISTSSISDWTADDQGSFNGIIIADFERGFSAETVPSTPSNRTKVTGITKPGTFSIDKIVLKDNAAVATVTVEWTSTTADALSYFYLDNTPIRNPDGTLNFNIKRFEFRPGTLTQSLQIDDFDRVLAQTGVGVPVTISGGAITRTLTNPNASKVRVQIVLPAFYSRDAVTGDTGTTSVDFEIAISTQGGAFFESLLTIEGKASSQTEKNYEFSLSTSGPWTIRVRRITADSSSQNLINGFVWQSFTAIVLNPLNYPYSAVFGIVLDSTQFSSVPKLGARLLGIKFKVPNNYNVTDRTYSGFWNGTFSVPVYTDNPAWIFYGLLTNSRFGVGKYVDAASIDIYSLYTISQYCDERVPDGYGGTEPRFRMSAYITNRGDAFKVLNDLISCFRGIMYWTNGQIYFGQDSPQNPEGGHLYTEANTVQEIDKTSGKITKPNFRYLGTAKRQRHTVAVVAYADPNDFFKIKNEYIKDADAIARYGYRELRMIAFGCASRGQAQRVGRWALLTERYDTDTITFDVATDGLLSRPGEVFRVADPLKMGSRRGGRISTATSSTVTLDQAFVIQTGKTYTLSVYNADGSSVDRAVTTAAGTYTTLSVADFGFTPKAESVWMITANDLAPSLWRTIGVVENTDGSFTMTGLQYNASKYSAVDSKTKIFSPPTTGSANSVPNKVSSGTISITTTQSISTSGSTSINTSTLQISWQPPQIFPYNILQWEEGAIFSSAVADPSITGYRVQYRRSGESWIDAGATSSPSITIPNVPDGGYQARIATIRNDGAQGTWVTSAITGTIKTFIFNFQYSTSAIALDMV